MACPNVTAKETKAQKNELICSKLHQLKVELGLKPGSLNSKPHALEVSEVTKTHTLSPLENNCRMKEGNPWFNP